MTTDKKLKRVVRERMAKTGERYAAARHHVVAGTPAPTPTDTHPVLLPGYRRVGGPILQLSALANALEARGAVAPHTGRPFTEAMLLGLGGGVGGGYFMFQFTGTPTVAVIGTRLRWHDDAGFLGGVMTRLGVTPDIFETAGRKAGEAALSAAMAAGRPVLAWSDKASLPYHHLPEAFKKGLFWIVGVVGVDDVRSVVLLDDHAAVPWEMDRAEFAVARGLIATSKHRLLHVDPPPASLDLRAGVLDALRAGHRERTAPPIRNFGLPALAKWADLVANEKDPKGWPRTLSTGGDLGMVLQWAFGSIESGTGGGGYRPLYASFLDEAAEITGLPLADVSARYRDVGALWTALADALLPDDVPPLREVRDLGRARSRSLRVGGPAREELEALARRKVDLDDRLASDFPMTADDRRAFFQGLRDRIEEIHREEVAATEALHALVGD